MADRLRWLAAVAGILLWLTVICVVQEGLSARHHHRCAGRAWTGSLDDCFNDYLPVFELLFVPAFILLTVYPFARIAFSLYAPPPERRGMGWRLAGRADASDYWPALHLMGVLGALWCLWRASSYSWAPEFLPFQFFWVIFAIWFAAGVVSAFPRSRRD